MQHASIRTCMMRVYAYFIIFYANIMSELLERYAPGMSGLVYMRGSVSPLLIHLGKLHRDVIRLLLELLGLTCYSVLSTRLYYNIT